MYPDKAYCRLECSSFHTNMSDLRKDGKYCDVKIHVEDRSFLCHRIILESASEYFISMFSGKFMESDASEISLKDTDPDTFAEILESVYNGREPTFNFSNIFDLLCLSDFLQMKSIGKSCIRFIAENAANIPNVSEIFLHACATNMTVLVNILQETLVKNFFFFWKCDKFVEISFNDLRALLMRYQSFVPGSDELPHKDENRILDVVIRWVHHSPQTRMVYFSELVELVDFRRISEEYFMFALKEYQCSFDLPHGWNYDPTWVKKYMIQNFSLDSTSALNPGNCDSLPILSNYRKFWKNDLTLYVYVNLESSENELPEPAYSTKTTVFSTNSRQSREWLVSCEMNINSSRDNKLQSIAVLDQSDESLLYHLKTDIVMKEQSFRSYSSVDLSAISRLLTPPPALCETFELCGMKANNSIYLNDCTYSRPSRRTFANSKNEAFSPDEIDRRIYRYNCELDKWFPVPEMILKPTVSRITVDNHLLYAIGSQCDPSSKHCVTGYVQAYDFRTSRWIELSRNRNKVFNLKYIKDACVLNRKIYAYDRSAGEVRYFDLVSTKWENIRYDENFGSDCYGSSFPQKMVSYENMLWFIGSNTYFRCSEDFHSTVCTFDPITHKWFKSDLLNDAVWQARASGDFDTSYIDHVFLFRSSE